MYMGSINFGRIDSIYELADIVTLATKFLICGTLRAELPYQKVNEVREKQTFRSGYYGLTRMVN